MPMSMSGKLADGKDVPKGLIPWLACTLTKGTKVCQGSIDRPAFIKTEPYLGIYQEIYTNRLAAVLEWQKTNATCLNAPAETGTCAALPEPYKFDYVLRVTEHPCKPRIPQSNKAAKTLKVPYAEVGTLMYAGGKQFDVTRATYYYLEGARSVQWSMRVPRQKGPMSPMFVAVINVTTGSYTFSGPATAQHGLMVAYPRFTYNTNMPWILNATETPTQIVDIFEVVTA
ncbi:hypothetical protein COHA_006650 [Chlorella ohadii]|uniref:Uncharacterized protein n=1 Tax=Chlorella ohadii TaxID=2649997 RepID=A0AAD5H3L4_9CHLO|nr:hypothetical protein COHA_006650 [Chlorella ohadii]